MSIVTAQASADPVAAAAFSAASKLMSAKYTRAPSATKRWATASPMPEPAPVTRAVLPSSRLLIVVPLSGSVDAADSGCPRLKVKVRKVAASQPDDCAQRFGCEVGREEHSLTGVAHG